MTSFGQIEPNRYKLYWVSRSYLCGVRPRMTIVEFGEVDWQLEIIRPFIVRLL